LPWAAEHVRSHRSKSGAIGILTALGFLACSPWSPTTVPDLMVRYPKTALEPRSGCDEEVWTVSNQEPDVDGRMRWHPRRGSRSAEQEAA
jgi:hypothetical protein